MAHEERLVTFVMALGAAVAVWCWRELERLEEEADAPEAVRTDG